MTSGNGVGVFKVNRKKTFSMKRENDADKLLDQYLQNKYDNMKD